MRGVAAQPLQTCYLFTPDCHFQWSHVPDQMMALTAIITAIFVVRQLRLSALQLRSEARTARATLLLTIDEQFETGGVSLARTRWVQERASIEAAAPPGVSRAALEELKTQGLADLLTAAWVKLNNARSAEDRNAAVAGLLALTVFPNWLETLGKLCREELLSIDDILSVYRSAIVMVMPAVIHHSRDRTQPGDARPARWENAIWLYEKAAGLKPGAGWETVNDPARIGRAESFKRQLESGPVAVQGGSGSGAAQSVSGAAHAP